MLKIFRALCFWLAGAAKYGIVHSTTLVAIRTDQARGLPTGAARMGPNASCLRSQPDHTIEEAVVHHSKIGRPMCALGQKQTSAHVHPMSALPPKADIAAAMSIVRITNCYIGGNFGNCVDRRGSLSSPSVWVRRGLRDRERHRLPALRAPSEYVVVSVDQLRKHLGLSTALEFGNWI